MDSRCLFCFGGRKEEERRQRQRHTLLDTADAPLQKLFEASGSQAKGRYRSVTRTIQLQLLVKKKEKFEEKEMKKVFGVLMKHIESNSRALAILGDLVKGSDPIAIFKKLKETYDADTSAVVLEIMEKFFDPPCEEDLHHFLNRKYKKLNDFLVFGTTSKVEDEVTIEETPHKISETVKVLMVFAMARKNSKIS